MVEKLTKVEPGQSTSLQYDSIINMCRDLFINKMKDYGTAWRILRLSSITDQIYIKAQRIRSIEEKGVQKVNEAIDGEFIGIINYCIIAVIQIELESKDSPYFEVHELKPEIVGELYDKHAKKSKELMLDKNHDYGEAWRGMRVSSMTDLILMKLLRVKQIEDNKGVALVSEGIDANYYDMINYAVFALIKMKETE